MKTTTRFFSFLSVFTLLLSACSEQSTSDDGTSPPLVGLDPSFTVHTFKIYDDLTVDVYTPTAPHPSDAYPIIYFNDGDVFKSTISSLTSYRFEGEGAIEPFIMVGVYSGGNRTNWYTPYNDGWITENWGPYAPSARFYTERFIAEIIPLVEAGYSIDPQRRAIFGFSLGGLHAAWATINYPETFSFSASLSPSFWVGDYAIFEEPSSQTSGTFYFDIGTKEWNNYVPLIGSLENEGLKYGKNIFYYEVPNGLHSEADWAARLHIPLGLFLNGPPTEVKQYDVVVECIPSQSMAGVTFQRINPIVTFTNGIRYSLSTSASYQIVSGAGEVLADGQFDVQAGAMEVEISLGAWSEHLTVSDCGN